MIGYKLISKKINENRKLVLAMNFFVTKYKKIKKFWFWRRNISMPNMEEIKKIYFWRQKISLPNIAKNF